MIEGLSHITLVVRELAPTAEFFKTIFDAVEVYESGDETFSISREKFLLVGDIWIAIMEGDPLSEKTYNHVAFKVAEADLPEYTKRIKRLGVEVREGRGRVSGEGKSLYFYDYDNHLFELHTGTLEQRLRGYERA